MYKKSSATHSFAKRFFLDYLKHCSVKIAKPVLPLLPS
jgi:hypothetical protein